MLTQETKDKLRVVVEVMQKYPERVRMQEWCLRQEKDGRHSLVDKRIKESLLGEECNTVGCIAGFALACFGDGELCVSWGSDARKLLGLTQDQGEKLFYSDSWPLDFSSALAKAKKGTKAYADVVVQRIEHFINTEGEEEE